MKKWIFLAAMAAVVVPGTAAAQRHDHMRQQRAELRDHARVRANRQILRRDRHVLRADRRALHAGQMATRVDRRAARAERNARRTHVAYVAPYRRWSYRPVSVGYRLRPAYYGPRYYITNYSAYDLQAPRNRWLRWIRYGDDLLLVNIRTGRVLDVVHYRFW